MNNSENDNAQIAAVVKLGLWLIFIAVLLIISRFGGSQNSNNNNLNNDISKEEQKDTVSYEKKLNNLVNNYEYTYEVKLGSDIYVYNGSKMTTDNGIKESGYVTKNSEKLYNYFLENGYVYQVNNGGLDKINSIYLSTMNANYFDVNKLKEEINEKAYISDPSNSSKKIYSLDYKEIIIYEDDSSINKIEVIIGEDYYKLSINKIGLIKEVNY